MTSLRKWLKPVATALLITTAGATVTAVQSRRAEAIMSYDAAWNPALLTGALVSLGLGVGGFTFIFAGGGEAVCKHMTLFGCLGLMGSIGVLSLAGIATGMALLDENAPAGIVFQRVSPELAKARGLTAEEALEWNDSRDELNAVAQSAAREIGPLKITNQAELDAGVARYAAVLKTKGRNLDPRVFPTTARLLQPAR